MSSTHTDKSGQAAAERELERVERVFAEQGLISSATVAGHARELALEAFAGFELAQEASQAARIVFAGRLFDAVVADLAADPSKLDALLGRLQPAVGVSRAVLARELLSLPGVATQPPAGAVKTVLGLLIGLTPVSAASLWRCDRTGAVQCVDDAGAGARSVAARGLARRLLHGEDSQGGARAELFGFAIEGPEHAVGALVARAAPRRRAAARASLRVVLPTLAIALERDAQMARNASDERALVEGGERRLMRLGFDLHDGPLQELLLLAQDLRLFREQLVDVLGEGGEQTLLRGRLDDLDARLTALESGLRRISTSVHASVLSDRPFAEALQDVVDAFATRSRLAPELRLDGDANGISPSQRIALLSVVGEALNNVREHSRTVTQVRIEIDFDSDGASARVVDDGCGFDVEAALLSAARRGRMGLAGIHERVRLLGGRCVVDSRPGGPTTVSVSLPRWEPLAGATTTAAAAL